MRERHGHQSFNLKISPQSALQVIYFSGNMAATKQIIGETLLKRRASRRHRMPHWSVEPPALLSRTLGSYRARFKSLLIEPAGHSLHCGRNVWLPVLHRKPPSFLCSGGTILQCRVCAAVGGGGEGVSGGTDICS